MKRTVSNQGTFSRLIVMGLTHSTPTFRSRIRDSQDLALMYRANFGYVAWELHGFRPVWRVA